MMRKSGIVSIIVIGVVIFGGVFWYRYWPGLRPAFGPAPVDITTLIPDTLAEDAHEHIAETDTLGAEEAATAAEQQNPLKLPKGYRISIFARGLGKPRVIAWDPAGTLLVSIPSAGKIVALPDENKDGTSDRVVTVVEELDRPHGIAFDEQLLSIAESGAVAQYEYSSKTFRASTRMPMVNLPAGGNHFTRTIQYGRDGMLYVTVGSSCNVCYEQDDRRAAMLRFDPQSRAPKLEPVAWGLRNTVFFAQHPTTGEWWGNDMGRDFLGDDLPPDELNIIHFGNYGWPRCYGNRIVDPFGGTAAVCEKTIPAHYQYQAHVAPLGLVFENEKTLYVAYHGSWNRSSPVGYKVVKLTLDDQYRVVNEEDFLTGFLTPRGALGRPVDLSFGPDGALYISDDKAGVIYRVTKTK
ncbi:PQQ-dependent sugar dehydrogenase [Candidatus Uhrbacteria bacterium]|nr:PQQ-dependent sugar dehydrogenase [Candidatus Uhrbacteria bacterium]